MTHTKEPWPEKEFTHGIMLGMGDYERARACINVCAGISTEYLQEAPQGAFAHLLNELEILLQKHDALKESLKKII